MAQFNVLLADGVIHDLSLIESYLVETYQELGEGTESAVDRASQRIDAAIAYLDSFERRPHRGTGLPAIHASLRSITYQNFVYYFEINCEWRSKTA